MVVKATSTLVTKRITTIKEMTVKERSIE